MLVKDGITNTIVVITRYFGGIKLGTGGLVRAYVSAAKAGIENAGIAEVHEMREDSYQDRKKACSRYGAKRPKK